MSSISRREFVGLLAGGAGALGLGACTARGDANAASDGSPSAAQEPAQTGEPSGSGAASAGSVAVVDFSYDGHTWLMARRIGELAGVEPFRINPTEPYPDSATGDEVKGYDSEGYDQTVDLAKQEQDQGVLPAYDPEFEGWDQVGTILLGYPIWWGDAPQVVKTFLSNHDWAGRTLIPFSSNEGSGWGRSLDTLEELAQGATLVEGIEIRGNEVQGSIADVDDWFQGLGL